MPDNQTMSEFAQSYGDDVYQSAFRLLGNSHRAEDVMQEVFLKVLKMSDSEIAQIHNPKAFLKTMATRKAIDVLRAAEAKKADVFTSLEEMSDEDHHGPEQEMQKRQLRRCFRQLLSRLPERDAQVFALRHVEEFSYEEIASALSVSVSSVGVILHRSQKKLNAWAEKVLPATLMSY